MGTLYMTPKQLRFLHLFRTRVAPRLGVEPSHRNTPKLLREAAALHELYIAQGEDACRARANELLQLDEPRAVKTIKLATELARAASFMGDGFSEAAKHTLWLAAALEHLFPHKRERRYKHA